MTDAGKTKIASWTVAKETVDGRDQKGEAKHFLKPHLLARLLEATQPLLLALRIALGHLSRVHPPRH